MPADPSIALQVNRDDLRSLVEAVVDQALVRLDAARAAIPERLAYSEAEAARLLGLQQHQLRDTRLRGEIEASIVMGRRIRYLREDLINYLMSRRTGAGP